MSEKLSEVKTGPSGIRFEISASPWFGPRSRGLKMLKEADWPAPVTPEQFIKYLSGRYPDIRSGVQFVRFHDCEIFENKKPWRQTFAIINTFPVVKYRQVLFDDARSIVDATGWYPLVTGRRIMERRISLARWFSPRKEIETNFGSQPFGNLLRVVDLSNLPEGTAIGLEFEGGILALDFGYSFHDVPQIRGGLLSHQHKDHTEGMTGITRKIPVITSQTAALQVRRHCGQVALQPVQVPSVFKIADLKIKILPGQHIPGSAIFVIQGQGDEIIYSGDYCLNNTYIKTSPLEILRLFSGKQKQWLLFDATFIGHEPKIGEISNVNTIRSLLDKASEERRSIVFLASGPDILMPAYLLHFRERYSVAKSPGRHLVVDKSIVDQLERTFESFILRQPDSLDPFVKAMYGRSMSNYLESVWLYPTQSPAYPSGPGDYFFTPLSARNHRSVVGTRPLVFTLGKESDSLKKTVTQIWGDSEVHHLSGPDFALHSSEKDVQDVVQFAEKDGVNVVLFHNFKTRIRSAFFNQGKVTVPEAF